MDKYAAVIADKMLVNKELVAEDVSFEIPSLALQTADLKAMGTLSIPMVGLLDDMQLTITKIGVDRGYAKMSKLEKLDIELRWVQDKVASDGVVSHQGCKAFLSVIPKEIPGISAEIGSATECSHVYTILRQQIFVNGEELTCVDRLNQILRINGVDYMGEVKRLL